MTKCEDCCMEYARAVVWVQRECVRTAAWEQCEYARAAVWVQRECVRDATWVSVV